MIGYPARSKRPKPSQSEASRLAIGKRRLMLRVDQGTLAYLDLCRGEFTRSEWVRRLVLAAK